jgi:DNA-binding MarR family transcriptional regulator
VRLELLLWIQAREDPSFFQGEPATELLAPQSAIREELGKLVELGMLFREEHHPGSRRLYYSRTDSPLWSIVEAARTALGQTGR